MIRFPARALPLLLLTTLLGGCSTLGYYADLINGHAEVLNQARPLAEVLADDSLDPLIRQRLQSLQLARDFAVHELGLPDTGSYREFADIGRSHVVWNVVATGPFSVQARQWCYVLAGCFSYRGFYRAAAAQAFAAQLRGEGLDVVVAGARAYSTLGWFDDPLLSSMLYADEARRIGVLFHELAHQQLYVPNDSAFNEAYATLVAEAGLQRWFEARHDTAAYVRYQQDYARQVALHELLLATRRRLANLYVRQLDPATMRREKARILAGLKQQYRRLRRSWQGERSYDAWMAQDLNNAHLALVATYHQWVPALRILLRNCDDHLACFYEQAQALARLPGPARRARLRALRS